MKVFVVEQTPPFQRFEFKNSLYNLGFRLCNYLHSIFTWVTDFFVPVLKNRVFKFKDKIKEKRMLNELCEQYNVNEVFFQPENLREVL